LLRPYRDPRETYKYLKKFYDLRSMIVHNGKRLSSAIRIDEQELTPKEFVADMESICREVLKTLIEKLASGVSLSNINEDLDKCALGS